MYLYFRLVMHEPLNATLDEKTNLHQICLVQICCKYEICKALQPVQRWQSPNLHKNGQIRRLPPLHWMQSFANFIFATYLLKANLMQIRFFVQCESLVYHIIQTSSCVFGPNSLTEVNINSSTFYPNFGTEF